MLDIKLKDIGQTVYKAIKALDGIDFGYLTVHGQGGKEMIEKAKKAANEIKSNPTIMMVTILTALGDADLKQMGNDNTVIEQVEKFNKNGPLKDCWLTTAVSSPVSMGSSI